MIYSVSGKLKTVRKDFAVVEAAGVGYLLKAGIGTLSQLPPVGSDVTLYTYMSVTQDGIALYGFIDEQELDLFKLLITVSGVGPKAALSVLSAGSTDRVIRAIMAGDAKSLKAPGIGPKTASRIILELKDKVGGKGSENIDFGFAEGISHEAPKSAAGEAISALEALGYSRTDAAEAVAKLSPDLSAEELIKGGLKALSAMLR